MTVKFWNASWWVELLARGLSPGDRETVLGDLAEAGETGNQALLSVAGLVIRRQLSMWRDWRPWVAVFGLVVPASFLLMGFSVSIAQAVLPATGRNLPPGLTVLVCNISLLAAWSATGGFAVGTISRRTTWISAIFSLLPCAFCLSRFHLHGLSPLCLLLFLPPALAGLYFGLRTSRIRFGICLAAAIVTTVLTIPHWNQRGAWPSNFMLSWPAWYLVSTAWRRKAPLRSGLHGE
ncbi:MAG TPA: hypothetical protein VKU01_01900 [Bryobacteraceae bacterium]|nr:hypothetical protein [Bryobacteraceae bacterium]